MVFNTNQPTSLIGFGLLLLFLFKGLVAYSLWFEKDLAVDLAIFDGAIGIIVCIISMIPFTSSRIEIVILVIYLIKLFRMKRAWKVSGSE